MNVKHNNYSERNMALMETKKPEMTLQEQPIQEEIGELETV